MISSVDSTLMVTLTQPGVAIPSKRESSAARVTSRITPYRQRSRKVEVPVEVLVTVTSTAASSEVTSSPPTATIAASQGLERSPFA